MMLFVYPEILTPLNIDCGFINTIVIENRKLFFMLLEDIYSQLSGYDGQSVLSKDYTPIDISKNLEVISDFIDFDINKKSIVTKVISRIERTALESEYFIEVQKILSQLEELIEKCSFEFSCNLKITKLNFGNLLKAVGIELNNEYSGNVEKAEKILDYMELVREFDHDKVFLTVNMRSYFEDKIMEKFMQSAISHEFKIIMIENREYEKLPQEKRLVIDNDLCEI